MELGSPGEASFTLSVEDITGDYADTERIDPETGSQVERKIMNIERVVDRIVNTMIAREKEGNILA
jgi:ATP-dependent phosphofructokinase / diphosphate-dependent phosphofructokinase